MTPIPFKTSPRGIALIAHFEDFASRASFCPARQRTIGDGHVILKHERELTTATITEAKARDILAADLAVCETYLNGVLPIWVSQHHFDALASFVFNCGIGNFDKSTLRQRLADGNRQAAAEEFKKWVFGGGKKLWGLHIRRVCESLLFQGMSDAAIANERARLQALKLRDW